jgi:hypothetical protein
MCHVALENLLIIYTYTVLYSTMSWINKKKKFIEEKVGPRQYAVNANIFGPHV